MNYELKFLRRGCYLVEKETGTVILSLHLLKRTEVIRSYNLITGKSGFEIEYGRIVKLYISLNDKEYHFSI